MQPKTYLISGAGSGIGRAITQKLAANHSCILLGRTSRNLEETLATLPGNNHQILVADIRDKKQLAKAAAQLNASFIDGIIANPAWAASITGEKITDGKRSSAQTLPALIILGTPFFRC